jgi:hypothetical protein
LPRRAVACRPLLDGRAQKAGRSRPRYVYHHHQRPSAPAKHTCLASTPLQIAPHASGPQHTPLHLNYVVLFLQRVSLGAAPFPKCSWCPPYLGPICRPDTRHPHCSCFTLTSYFSTSFLYSSTSPSIILATVSTLPRASSNVHRQTPRASWPIQ